MQQYATTKPAAEGVTPCGKNGQPSRFRRALGGMLTAVLLLPVPAFAFTWVTGSNGNIWTAVGTPVNVANDATGFGAVNGQPDSLFIQPTVTSNTPTSITLTADFLPNPSNPGMSVNPVQLSNFYLNSGTNLQIAIWTTIGTTNEADIIGSSTAPYTLMGNNMFQSNLYVTGPSLAAGTQYTLHVQFAITSGNWSTSSTNYLLTTFAD